MIAGLLNKNLNLSLQNKDLVKNNRCAGHSHGRAHSEEDTLLSKASQNKVEEYKKEMDGKILDEETPLDQIYDHKKVFLMACSSASKGEYSDRFESLQSSVR